MFYTYKVDFYFFLKENFSEIVVRIMTMLYFVCFFAVLSFHLLLLNKCLTLATFYPLKRPFSHLFAESERLLSKKWRQFNKIILGWGLSLVSVEHLPIVAVHVTVFINQRASLLTTDVRG